MQRPRVTPVVKLRHEFNSIKRRGHVADDPEDQPHGRPRLPDDHRDVFARQAQSAHADEIDHPEDGESPVAEGVVVVCHLGGGGRGGGEWDLERQRHKRVGERHE